MDVDEIIVKDGMKMIMKHMEILGEELTAMQKQVEEINKELIDLDYLIEE